MTSAYYHDLILDQVDDESDEYFFDDFFPKSSAGKYYYDIGEYNACKNPLHLLK